MLNEPFTRLLQEQHKATAHTESKINQLAKFKSDYEDLIPRFEELQKFVSQPALIPFGRKAFVHGRLIHTNEILAHLGGAGAGEHDYFAQLSTHDAVKLINRRIGNIASQITLLQQQKKLIKDRIPYTFELANKPLRVMKDLTAQDVTLRSSDRSTDGEDLEEVEIREHYDSDMELNWQEQHRRHCRQERGLEVSTTSSSKRVSFDLSNLHCQPTHSRESSDSSIQSEDVDSKSTIYFKHSKSQVTIPPVSHSSNCCWLTPSEAANMVIKLGFIQGSQTTNDDFQLKSQLNGLQNDSTENYSSPLSGMIYEHKSEPKLQTMLSRDTTANMSRFRRSRLKPNIN